MSTSGCVWKCTWRLHFCTPSARAAFFRAFPEFDMAGKMQKFRLAAPFLHSFSDKSAIGPGWVMRWTGTVWFTSSLKSAVQSFSDLPKKITLKFCKCLSMPQLCPSCRYWTISIWQRAVSRHSPIRAGPTQVCPFSQRWETACPLNSGNSLSVWPDAPAHRPLIHLLFLYLISRGIFGTDIRMRYDSWSEDGTDIRMKYDSWSEDETDMSAWDMTADRRMKRIFHMIRSTDKYLIKSFRTFYRYRIPNFQVVTASEMLQNYWSGTYNSGSEDETDMSAWDMTANRRMKQICVQSFNPLSYLPDRRMKRIIPPEDSDFFPSEKNETPPFSCPF